MLRLDPAHPPLWRSPTTLQFGATPVAIIPEPPAWQQRLLQELERGIPHSSLEPVAEALGAPPGAATTFVELISGALESGTPPAPGRLVLQSAVDTPADDDVAAALRLSGFAVERRTWNGHGDTRFISAEPVVLLAHHVVEPRRSAALMARDVPHVPVVFTGGQAEIGPIVLPGRTACLACIAAHRRESDPAWPHVAAQLVTRRPTAVAPALAMEAGLVAARLLSPIAPSSEATFSLTLRSDSPRRTTRAHRPHAGCGCRSLGETATAVDRGAPQPTRATVFAQTA